MSVEQLHVILSLLFFKPILLVCCAFLYDSKKTIKTKHIIFGNVSLMLAGTSVIHSLISYLTLKHEASFGIYPLCTMFHPLCQSVILLICSLSLPLACICLSAVCLSPLTFPLCLTTVSHPSYTAAQAVEERWACCQPARAPVGQSISSIKDMLSTRVYPPGLEP